MGSGFSPGNPARRQFGALGRLYGSSVHRLRGHGRSYTLWQWRQRLVFVLRLWTLAANESPLGDTTCQNNPVVPKTYPVCHALGHSKTRAHRYPGHKPQLRLACGWLAHVTVNIRALYVTFAWLWGSQAERRVFAHTLPMRKAFAAAFLVLLLAAAATVWTLRQNAQEQSYKQSATVVEAVKRVMKLSTVEMTISDWRLRKDSKQLWGFIPIACEKTVAVFFRGTVSAGFDLGDAQATSIDIKTDAATRRVRVSLPPARLLYTDVPAPELVVTDGSLCNPVSGQDYARLHEDARKAVQEMALSQGILQKAEAQAKAILSEVVRPLGYELDLQVAEPALISASPE